MKPTIQNLQDRETLFKLIESFDNKKSDRASLMRLIEAWNKMIDDEKQKTF